MILIDSYKNQFGFTCLSPVPFDHVFTTEMESIQFIIIFTMAKLRQLDVKISIK